MRIVSAQEVSDTLAWPELIGRLEACFDGSIETPLRHHHTIPRDAGEATLLLMPAWQQAGYIGTKMVNVFPHNADRGLPAISGVYLLCDGDTGQPLACIEGGELTRRRTAAASAVASRYLSREDANTLVMVGTGKLAPMLIEAHAAVRPISRIKIWGRQPEKAQYLAEAYADRFDCEVITSLSEAVASADIVSCATLSSEPLIRGEWLRPGTHLDLVGAFRPTMRESDGACLSRAEVFVDTYEGAKGEAGDIHHAIEEGDLQFGDIRGELRELISGASPGRSSSQAVTLFKSVGASLEDLAAAIEVWEKLES